MAGAPQPALDAGHRGGGLLVRAACTRGAAAASYNASRTAKTLRSAIYFSNCCAWAGSLRRLCPPLRYCSWQAKASSSWRPTFGAYLPQFFHAMLAPVTLFVVLAPVSVKAAVILPDDLRAADPGFHRGCAEICQTAAGQILAQYAALGVLLENLQGLTTLKIYQADEARHQAMNREAESTSAK